MSLINSIHSILKNAIFLKLSFYAIFSYLFKEVYNGNHIVNDCKRAPLVLNNVVNTTTVYSELYLVIGLATKNNFDGVEYPQVIGLHTKPEIPMLNSYPN